MSRQKVKGKRFNFVPEGSQKLRVTTTGNHVSPIVLSNIKVPRNGYCFVYISNESPTNVFFDDLQVRHDRGRILEENHYYAYGLKIAPLSSKAYHGPANAYQYQGDYSEFDDDLGWNDFMLRSYDPQLGRFLQWDPYDEFSSGYVGMGNDPVNLVDPTGGKTVPGLGCWTGGGGSIFNGLKLGATLSSVLSITGNAMKVGSTLSGGGGLGDPPTKTPPSAESRKHTDDLLRKIFPKPAKPRPSPTPWLLFIYFLFSPSDANARIDDTIEGIGGWKRLERERDEQERNEDDYEDRNPDKRIKYVTYTKQKINKDGTITVYSGRTSGPANESAEDIVNRRDMQHSKNRRLYGYSRASVDVEAVGGSGNPAAKWAIRGREQQLIDRFGRAQRDLDSFGNSGTSGNVIRGVSKYNEKGRKYHYSSNMFFREELHEFTGLR